MSTPTTDEDTSSPTQIQCQSCRKHIPTSSLNDYNDDSNDWKCSDCASLQLDKILAWRPCPPDAVEANLPDPPDIKSALPREYLVKWTKRSYRRVQWIPHMWLVSNSYAKLKNFLATGSRVELLEEPVSNADIVHMNGSLGTGTTSKREGSPPAPLKDAELHIPPAWKTIDRILDVKLWYPPLTSKPRPSRPSRRAIVSDDEADNMLPRGLQIQLDRAFEDGEEPDDALLDSIEEYEVRTKERLGTAHIDLVVWAFIKWQDLEYEEG